MMNGGDIKKAAINKAKQVATAAINPPAAANGNGSGNAAQKRRKGGNLKPIITTEGVPGEDASSYDESQNSFK